MLDIKDFFQLFSSAVPDSKEFLLAVRCKTLFAEFAFAPANFSAEKLASLKQLINQLKQIDFFKGKVKDDQIDFFLDGMKDPNNWAHYQKALNAHLNQSDAKKDSKREAIHYRSNDNLSDRTQLNELLSRLESTGKISDKAELIYTVACTLVKIDDPAGAIDFLGRNKEILSQAEIDNNLKPIVAKVYLMTNLACYFDRRARVLIENNEKEKATELFKMGLLLSKSKLHGTDEQKKSLKQNFNYFCYKIVNVHDDILLDAPKIMTIEFCKKIKEGIRYLAQLIKFIITDPNAVSDTYLILIYNNLSKLIGVLRQQASYLNQDATAEMYDLYDARIAESLIHYFEKTAQHPLALQLQKDISIKLHAGMEQSILSMKSAGLQYHKTHIEGFLINAKLEYERTLKKYAPYPAVFKKEPYKQVFDSYTLAYAELLKKIDALRKTPPSPTPDISDFGLLPTSTLPITTALQFAGGTFSLKKSKNESSIDTGVLGVFRMGRKSD